MPVDENAASVRELAEILGVSPDLVRRLASSGDIPAFRVGRLWRFWPEQVREHLQQRATARDSWSRSSASQAALAREERKHGRSKR